MRCSGRSGDEQEPQKFEMKRTCPWRQLQKIAATWEKLKTIGETFPGGDEPASGDGK